MYPNASLLALLRFVPRHDQSFERPSDQAVPVEVSRSRDDGPGLVVVKLARGMLKVAYSYMILSASA